MNIKSSITTIFIILLSLPVFSQRLEKFEETPEKYLEQLQEYMTASKREVMEETYKDFEEKWRNGLYTEAEIVQIIKTSNAMLEQRMTASPYFLEYLKCLNEVKNSADGEQRFTNWHEVVDKMLAGIENRKLNPFLDFLEFSSPFFLEKKLRDSKTGVNWLAVSESFIWKFENNQPIIDFKEADLVCTRKDDSITINKTKGIYYPTEGIWKGESGKVTWERFDLGPEVYCELTTYEIEVIKSLYRADSVKLHYPQFFGEDLIQGSFEDKLVVGNDATGGSYPRFESKEQVLKISNIGKGIEYLGGFRLQGTTVYGYGSKNNPAKIEVYNDENKLTFKGFSELFVIRKGERIVAEQVESTLYFDQDSIYHPSVNIRFDIDTKHISLNRGERASDRNPFYSSMHKVNINTDDVVAYLAQDSVFFGKQKIQVGKRENEVSFESDKFFREADYRRIQNIASYNPIAIIKVVAEKEGKTLEADYLAKRMDSRYSVENIQSLLYDLVAQGFINYDSDNEMVEVKDKIFHYTDASVQKVDYDVLKINSVTEGTNGVFDLKSKSINIEGVSSLEFSEKQRVGMLPFDNQLVLKENRDIDFDGKVFAGFTTLLGTGFHFNYNKFQIDLDSARYFDIFVPTGEVDKQGKMVANAIGSRIEHATGVLLIDAPANKSGREDIPLFPSLQTKAESFVFYDRKATQGGVYNRDSFFFKLDPFSFNSLDRFGPQDIKFEGEMVSADILPPFRETLVLMPEDTSLGFNTKTPPEGMDAYLGKGKYRGDVNLSNRGFLAQGTVDYLGATIDSDDIIFKPKQMLCSAERFDLEEDRTSEIEVPQVRGIDVNIEWVPYNDSMYVRSKEAPFALFREGEYNMKGTLILTPGGLKANGTLDWDKASMTSKMFNFGAFSTTADTASIKIRAFNTDEFALETNNLNADVNFENQIGVFKANDEFLETILPYNQYKTSMNEFTWDMKEETVTFKADENKFGTFTSIHPDQDSLRFKGKSAFYNLKTSQLLIGGVPFIQTCDALVYPDTADIEIKPGGVMTTLENARIVADTSNKYHVINRATVDILGKKDYRAKGYYEYNIGEREQEIFFEDIVGERVGKGSRDEKPTETRATGEVASDAGFYIDKKTEFYGTIGLSASSKNLNFNGFARLDADKLPDKRWFSISSEGDKKDLKIQFDEPRSETGEPLNTGLYLSKETARMYPRIVQQLYFRKDRPILPVKGLFKYDPSKDRFIFGDSLKVASSALAGNQIIFNNKDASVDMEGTFELGSGLKYISVKTFGTAETAFKPEVEQEVGDTTIMVSAGFDIKAKFMMGIDLLIPERLLKMIENDIKSAAFDAPPVNYLLNRDYYRKATAELVPESSKEFNNILERLNVGALEIPKKNNEFDLFFSYLPMKWDPDYQSFVSTEDKLGLYSINGDEINKMVTCYVECKMPTTDDDRLYIYLKSPSGFYYFFGFQQGILNVVSDNMEFNDEVINMKKKEAVVKMGDDEFFEIAPVEPGTADMFVRRVQAANQKKDN
jgi:hypothetical protein